MSLPQSVLEPRSRLTKRRVLDALLIVIAVSTLLLSLQLLPRVSLEMPASALDASVNRAADFVVANRGVLPVYSVDLRIYVRHYEGRSSEWGIKKADDFGIGPQPVADVLQPHQHVRVSMAFFSIGNIKNADVTSFCRINPGSPGTPGTPA
jgi:hypothetical protein